MGKFNVLGLNPESKLMSFFDLGYEFRSKEGAPRNIVEFSLVYGMKNVEDFH